MESYKYSGFWLLMLWAVTMVTVGLIEDKDEFEFLFLILLLVMPAVAGFPNALKFLFCSNSLVLSVLVLCGFIVLWALWSWSHDQISNSQLIMMVAPFFQLIIIFGAYMAFVQILNREPVDVSLNFSAGLFWDRVFAISTFLIAFLIPINLLYLSQAS